MKPTEPSQAATEPMDHDVSAGWDAESLRMGRILCVRVGDVQREVKAAVGVACVDDVKSFGGFVIALALLRTAGACAERHGILPSKAGPMHTA